MSIKKLVLRGCGLLVPVLGALYSAGCGGSAFSEGATGGTAGSATGAAGGAAGAGVSGNGGSAGMCAKECPLIACGPGSVSVTQPGDCCPTCVPNGQGGAGGASGGSAGAGGCSGVVACPAIACAMGWTSVTNPGDCCPTCVPSGQGGSGGSSGSGGSGGSSGCAGATACPAIDCAQGYTLEQTAGECCPTCVPNADACMQGQQGYSALRQKLLQGNGVLACKVNSDCTALPWNAYCGEACAVTPVSVTSEPGINTQLSSYATDNCSTCTPLYPPCAVPLTPICENGVCATGVLTAG
jgi:hypothetical protein